MAEWVAERVAWWVASGWLCAGADSVTAHVRNIRAHAARAAEGASRKRAPVAPLTCGFASALVQVKKRDIINLQNREETGFTWQSMIEGGYIE